MKTSTSTSEAEQTKSLDVSQFTHTPFYCEENVYFLCKKLCEKGIAADAEGSDLYVVFISNDKKQVPLWHQKASKRADGVVLWDYHVICIQKGHNDSPDLVWDIDSSLPFPCPLARYIPAAIRPSFQLFPEFQRLYRVVHARIYMHHFASDRRHMKDPAGNWKAQPPSYEPIVAKDGTVNNLNEYVEIHAKDLATNMVDAVDSVKNRKLGIVISEDLLEEFFAQIP